MPLFSPSELETSKAPPSLVPQCGLCGLYKTCRSPKMPVTGRGGRKILIVGESPGKEEDRKNRQFVGESGQILRDALRICGVSPNRDCWFTNALICRPENNEIKDEKWIDYCRPNLLRTIKELDPNVVLLVGKVPLQGLVGHIWKEDLGGINRWVGFRIPNQKPNLWICPTYHPESLLYNPDDKVLSQLFHKHVEAAVSITKKPWKTVPDYNSKVVKIYEDKEAAKAIQGFLRRGKDFAFDYETNMLKPDSEEAEIVTCALSDGKITIAYPWLKRAIAATKELLQSDVVKIGQNAKFEERWTLAKLGCNVNNWRYDAMLGSHVIDNRPGITSIKFQSYVLLGAPSYDDDIKPYLKSKDQGGNSPNRIREADLGKLLLYNGLDALLEYKVGKKQMPVIFGARK